MTDLQQQFQLAKTASQHTMSQTAKDRSDALYAIADAVTNQRQTILSANQKDLNSAAKNDLAPALLDRLTLTDARIDAMIDGARQIAAMRDILGSIDQLTPQARGFKVGKMRVPLGVIGIIYESRPNVTLDAAVLCIKSGNATVLRGGSEAIHSNKAIADAIAQGLAQSNLDQNLVQLVQTTDRSVVTEMLQATGLIDVIIPRGGKGLVRVIAEQARVPVIKHLDGICHTYIDAHADDDMAVRVAVNAKTYRYGICGATETMLIHRDKVAIFPDLVVKLREKSVKLHGCAQTLAEIGEADDVDLTTDWAVEYLAPEVAIKIVESLDDAIAHINRYGSHHTDAIISRDSVAQQQFLHQVDSASVMVNTATCFADGYEYGLGAEIGISTDKLHVRGPVGIEGLTGEKYIVMGNGEVRG